MLLSSKDVRLPLQLQRAMAAEAEAAREARAKVMVVMTTMVVMVVRMAMTKMVVMTMRREVKTYLSSLALFLGRPVFLIMLQVIAAEGEQKVKISHLLSTKY